jgi:hypothetical protein
VIRSDGGATPRGSELTVGLDPNARVAYLESVAEEVPIGTVE